MAAAGFDQQQSVNLAILDGGFWLDSNGNPLQGSSGIGTELPWVPVNMILMVMTISQTVQISQVAPVEIPCPWHGNGSASVAAGFVNNGAAIAGSGGQIARPFLFKLTATAGSSLRAVRTLIPWGAQVANMSFGGCL